MPGDMPGIQRIPLPIRSIVRALNTRTEEEARANSGITQPGTQTPFGMRHRGGTNKRDTAPDNQLIEVLFNQWLGVLVSIKCQSLLLMMSKKKPSWERATY